jgi:hypothetical protein
MTFYFSDFWLFAFVDTLVYARRINVIILFHVQKESNSLEDQAQEVCSNMKEFGLSKLRLAAKHDEPYDTENLNTVPDGYR